MATATATITVDPYPFGFNDTLNWRIIYGTIAIQASPAQYATGGLALSWAGILGNLFGSKGDGTNAGTPHIVYIQSKSPQNSTLYTYVWNSSTEKLQIFYAGSAVSTPEAEFPNATNIPANVSNDVIAFEAHFLRV